MKPLSRRWTPQEIERLLQLVAEGASAARASVALKRSLATVRTKANALGTPFVPIRKSRKQRLEREKLRFRRAELPVARGSGASQDR
jgi:hypothetical protein